MPIDQNALVIVVPGALIIAVLSLVAYRIKKRGSDRRNEDLRNVRWWR